MHFSKTFLAAVVCVTQVGLSTAIAFTKWPSTIVPGEPATVTWAGDPNVKTTITLRKGSAGDLKKGDTITAEALGSSFTWIPKDDLEPGDDYALEISQADSINYSGHITVAAAKDKPAAPKNATDPMPPSSKGPKPPPSPPEDELEKEGVAKGNGGKVDGLTPGNAQNMTSGKSAMQDKKTAGTASLRNMSLDLLLGAAVFAFCFTR